MVADWDMDNVEAFATSIATEVTTSLTCDSAYKDVTQAWIEPKHFQLNENYYRLRTVVVLKQLMRASVRLAQLMEAIATRYYETERALNPVAETTTTVSPAPRSTNRYAILALEFDVDDHLYEYGQTDDEEIDSEDADDSVAETASVASSSTASTLSKHERRELKKQRAKELKKAEKKRAKNKQRRDRKKRESKFVDGVDLNSLVLIRRDVRLFITAKSRVTSKTFLPNRHIIVFVKFANQGANDEPIGFLLDANVFPEKAYTAGFLLRMFNALKGVEDDASTEYAESAIDGVETFGSDGKDNVKLAEALAGVGLLDAKDIYDQQDRTAVVSEREYAKKFRNAAERAAAESAASKEAYRHLRRMEDDLIVYKFDSAIFVSAFSLCRRVPSTVFRLNKFDVMETKKSLRNHVALLVDARVIDDKISDSMHEIIRAAIHSTIVQSRTESLELVNPGFRARITDFITSAFGGSTQDQIMAMTKFRHFDCVPRPDKPYMKTLSADISVDLARQSMMAAFVGRQRAVTAGPLMFPPFMIGMARPESMTSRSSARMIAPPFSFTEDMTSSIFGLPPQVLSSSSRTTTEEPSTSQDH